MVHIQPGFELQLKQGDDLSTFTARNAGVFDSALGNHTLTDMRGLNSLSQKADSLPALTLEWKTVEQNFENKPQTLEWRSSAEQLMEKLQAAKKEFSQTGSDTYVFKTKDEQGNVTMTETLFVDEETNTIQRIIQNGDHQNLIAIEEIDLDGSGRGELHEFDEQGYLKSHKKFKGGDR